jgi:hypothetical protein
MKRLEECYTMDAYNVGSAYGYGHSSKFLKTRNESVDDERPCDRDCGL